MRLLAFDAAMLARIDAQPSAGDEVTLGLGGDRYVIAVVYSEARDGRPFLLLRVNRVAVTVGEWFECIGRVGREDVRVVARGAYAEHVARWRVRYPW